MEFYTLADRWMILATQISSLYKISNKIAQSYEWVIPR
jgi:hypothetical protein